MTEVLLLGTFHFMESSIDFYSSEIQNELDVMVRKLLAFHPDAIALEAAVKEQERIDESYKVFQLADLQDRNKMQNGTLGEICMYGQTHPITYKNEAIQIGYRLGKMLEHSKVYAIDDDTSLNMDVMQDAPQSLKEAMDALYADIDKHRNDTIADLHKYYNSEEWSKLNHSLYIQTNRISVDNDYAGAEMVAKWYERNLKIFSNIQRLAARNERILVVYGAGHLQILRDLVNADSSLKLADVYEYL